MYAQQPGAGAGTEGFSCLKIQISSHIVPCISAKSLLHNLNGLSLFLVLSSIGLTNHKSPISRETLGSTTYVERGEEGGVSQ